MLRIAHISPIFHPAYSYGGPVESSYQLSRALARAGCVVRVLTTTADGADELEVDTSRELELEPGFRVRYCRRRAMGSTSPGFLRHLPELVRQSDVVHLNAVYNFPTIPTLLAATIYSRPAVLTARGNLQRWEEVRRPGMKAAWEAVCRVVGPSRLTIHYTSVEERDESAGRFPSAGAVVIPNGVIVPPVLMPHVEDAVFRLLALGRLHPIKGIENLLLACANLRDRGFRPFSLTVAGSGDANYTAKLSRQIDELSLGSIVALVGEVRGEEKARLFAESDVLLAPSYRENFGNAIAEALAHQLPVVAAKGTPWASLEARGAGLWVANDPASLADSIARASSMPLREMGARGRKWVERDFGWDHVAARMISVYSGLLRPA